MQPIQMLSEELNILKAEVMQSKANHASLHQTTVDANAGTTRSFMEVEAQINTLKKKVSDIDDRTYNTTSTGGYQKKPLVEPKQVVVPDFHGSMTDGRAKFLEWEELVKDRICLHDKAMHDALAKAEMKEGPIDEKMSEEFGVNAKASHDLHSFLKNWTKGTANAIARGNDDGVGLESWRRLCGQFNPKTVRSTLNNQHHEQHPRGAKKMADLPACMAEWERNLRRCVQEGRAQPTEEGKRLALLKMLPTKQREAIWETADKLYPTFAELLTKVQRMIQDDIDTRQGIGAMDIDNVESDDEDQNLE